MNKKHTIVIFFYKQHRSGNFFTDPDLKRPIQRILDEAQINFRSETLGAIFALFAFGLGLGRKFGLYGELGSVHGLKYFFKQITHIDLGPIAVQ